MTHLNPRGEFPTRADAPDHRWHATFAACALTVLATLSACSNDASGGDCPAALPTAAAVTPDYAQASDVSVDPMATSKATLDAAVSAGNAFTVALYAELLASAGTRNLFASPLSASLGLGMLYAGAAGRTASEMATALHFDGDAASVAEGQGALGRALSSRATSALAAAKNAGKCSSPAAYQLQIVDSVWGERTYPWERPFLETLARGYGTGVALEDFVGAPGQALRTIDAWVSAETGGSIEGLLPPDSIDAKTRIVLVNAVHVKLPWATAFDPAMTAPRSFTRPDGSKVQTPFMNVEGSFPYSDDGMAQTIALPFSGNELSIVVSLPHVGVDLATYEATLSPTSPTLTVPVHPREAQVALPKIGFTSPSFSLAAALEGMGMRDAFDGDLADFTGMCATPPDGGRLSVKDVIQKTMLEMKETGVEAAVATAVVSCNCSASIEVESVIVDRPYLVSVVDEPTGAVLFLGHIEDPTDSGGV